MVAKIDVTDPGFVAILNDLHDEAFLAGSVATAAVFLGGIVPVSWVREQLPSVDRALLDRAVCGLISKRTLVPWTERDGRILADDEVVEAPGYGRVGYLAIP